MIVLSFGSPSNYNIGSDFGFVPIGKKKLQKK